jgi:segregation and condensation protein B
MSNLAQLEALLFVHGEPIRVPDIARTLGVDEPAARGLIDAFIERLRSDDRGLMVLSHGDKIQLVTKPEVRGVLTNFVAQELASELTPASVETLALITYLGPVSKVRIEHYRGVNSSIILRNLGLRGLVNRIADPERAGGWLYEASFELLKHLGVSRREDLPDYTALRAQFDAKSA